MDGETAKLYFHTVRGELYLQSSQNRANQCSLRPERKRKT